MCKYIESHLVSQILLEAISREEYIVTRERTFEPCFIAKVGNYETPFDQICYDHDTMKTDGDHRYRLLSHLRTLLHLPDLTVGLRDALKVAADWLTHPAANHDTLSLLPWQLLWSREAASSDHPYTWFTLAPEFARHTLADADSSEMSGSAVLTTDTRFDDTCDFPCTSLSTILAQPCYGLWSP